MSSEKSQIQNEELLVKDLAVKLLGMIDQLESRISKIEEKMPDSFDIFYKPPGGSKHQKLHLSLDELYGKINKIERELNDAR
jgi:hypothetical protein